MDDANGWWKAAVIVAALFLWPGPQLVRHLRAGPEPEPEPVLTQRVDTARPAPAPSAAEWLESIRPGCTERDVYLTTDLNPPPSVADGTAHEAACFALAGHIPTARALVLGLPPESRLPAVEVLFAAVDDARPPVTDRTLASVMELVLEFWPNHFHALYHAGAAHHRLGDAARARDHLLRFLALYGREDAWAEEARRMLAPRR